jgi:hypothetical protein
MMTPNSYLCTTRLKFIRFLRVIKDYAQQDDDPHVLIPDEALPELAAAAETRSDSSKFRTETSRSLSALIAFN